jgi:hypothetical protein
LLRFGSGTLRRPASSAGAETYASVFDSSTLFLEFVTVAWLLGQHLTGTNGCVTSVALPGSATSRAFEGGAFYIKAFGTVNFFLSSLF